MGNRVYIETTIPSFYFESRSEPEMVARRAWTRRWWAESLSRYEAVTSAAVVEELSRGDFPAREDCLRLIEHLPLVPVEPAPAATLRGVIEGKAGSIVAGSMLDEGLFALVTIEGREYWMQPLAPLVDEATRADYVIYRTEDVVCEDRICGGELAAPAERGRTGSAVLHVLGDRRLARAASHLQGVGRQVQRQVRPGMG